MKSIFYLLIFVILAYCLMTTYKVKEKFVVTSPPSKPVITNVTYNNNSLTIEWNQTPYDDPNVVEPIKGYIMLVKKKDNTDNGLYMQVANISNCVNCSYVLSNLNLVNDAEYYCSVLATNTYGVSPPADQVSFIATSPTTLPPTSPPTLPPTPTPTSSPVSVSADVLMPTTAPTKSGIYQMTLEDRIKAGEDARRVYLDNELNNMIIRANGVYEVDSDKLSYPDTYLSDVKESVNTLNNMVKKDLQEYRMNIHITANK